MYADVERGWGPEARHAGGWRTILAAWLVMVVIFVAGFAAIEAWRSDARSAAAPGIVIPRHNPACVAWNVDAAPNPQTCPSAPITFDPDELNLLVP